MTFIIQHELKWNLFPQVPILRAVSSKRKVNTESLELLSEDISKPMNKLQPTIHQALAAHSAALIAANESTGLGSFSEEPLEHNKNIRNYMEHLSRKNTQNANLTDVPISCGSSQTLSVID